MTRRVKATFDYVATEPGELSIKKGDIIIVLEEDSTGWWKGDLKGVVGFFPSNFSEPYEEQPAADSSWSQRRMSMAPKPLADNASTSSEEYVRAKHNYKGSTVDGELTFSKGDIIKVINKDESGWWKGELNGKIGFLPHNFVTPVAGPNSGSISGGSTSQGGSSAAAKTPASAPAPQSTTGTSVSAASKAKALKGKAAATTSSPAISTAQSVGSSSNANDSRALEEARAVMRGLEEQRDALQSQLDEARARAESAERRAEEAKTLAEDADMRREKAVHEREQVEQELRQWKAENATDWDLNQLRQHKHRLKEVLEKVQLSLNNLKACPVCETNVKDCILVPCLHAFCHKCGEKNKKQVKCSVCGLAPERIYLLSGKK